MKKGYKHISEAHLGKPLSEETKLCNCGCGKKVIIKPFHKYYGTTKYVWGHNNKGKMKLEISRNKLYRKYIIKQKSTTQIGKELNVDHKTILNWLKKYNIPIREKSKAWLGKKFLEEHREKISEGLVGHKITGETIEKIRKSNLGKKRSKETRKKIHKALIKNWKNKEYREKQIKAILKGLFKRPTSYEQKIIGLCKEFNLPFDYTGDGKVIINYVNPDFIDNNGSKKIIETYCNYWHPKNYEEVRRKRFAAFGFKTLFLDDEDLNVKNWKEICLNKIQTFNEENKVGL